ncbi:ABC transporter permease [Nocardia macrotermitis]|uniref:Doxorubicin resistance ABC transporter permease protein DrrB n=1 Tax=Nocardia macrotermitis TaxID=2585198 RepID=A0A7K0DE15_9NOCA|nr:ABC transporter permease [Nocardia macrotermitis]MQY23104.1 Doxorubicin resistance ABC transporter permease protein DrrB [Nocardia macrotermitis]
MSEQSTIALPPPGLQWRALSGRTVRAAIREGDLVFGFLAPMIFFLCFYVPLRHSMERTGMNYAQYLLPVIILQGMFFTAMSAADRAALDTASGMGTRLRSMPVLPWIPMAARMSANASRAVVAIAGAVVIGSIFGFRFHDLGTAIVFVLLAMLFAVGLVIGADVVGTATGNPEIGAQILLLPQLLLIMASTGFVPVEGFPGWIQPFVRWQPVSVCSDALRALSSGRYDSVGAALVWSIALIVVFAAVSARIGRRAR